MPKQKQEPINFEDKLQQLTVIVEKMENGNLSLEQALESFEQGIALTRECQQALQQAEQKIQILLKKNNEFSLTNFAPDESNDATSV